MTDHWIVLFIFYDVELTKKKYIDLKKVQHHLSICNRMRYKEIK